jgi:hypothetical protein
VASNSATAEKKWLTTQGFWKRKILLQIPVFHKKNSPKIAPIAYNMKRCLRFFLLSYFEFSQIQ